MGIGRNKKKIRKTTNSKNPYMIFLVKLYHFLVRRLFSKFNNNVLKRLITTRRNRPPMSIQSLSRLMKDKGGIAVVIGSVTGDKRNNQSITKGLKVCALRFTETA